MGKMINKISSNVLFLAIAAFLVSIYCYTGFLKLVPICLVSLIYFLGKKEVISFKNNLIFSFVFSFLRIISTILFNTDTFLFSFYKVIVFSLFDFLFAFFAFCFFSIILYTLYVLHKSIKNKRIELPEVKMDLKKIKVVLALIGIVLLCCLIIQLPKRMLIGYFVKGPEMNYPHKKFTSFQINEDEVLILGHKRPDNTKSIKEQIRIKDTDNQYNKHISLYNETPSEILDLNTGKFKEIKPKANFFYESEGVALDKNKVLLTRVCKTDKTDDEGLSYCYLNNMAAIWDVKNQNVDFIKTNCFDRRDSTIKKINNNEILISGGSYPIVPWNRKLTKKEIKDLREKGYEITLYDVQKNQCKTLAQPDDYSYHELTTDNNSIKLYKNEKFYNFDFNTKKLSEIQPTQKDYIIYGMPEKTSGEIKEKLKQGRYYSAYLCIPITNNYILYFGGLTPGFSSLNINDKAHVIDFKEKKIYKVPGLPWGTYGSNFAFLKNGNLIIFGGDYSNSSTKLLNKVVHKTLIFKPGILIKNKRSKS